MSTGKPTFECTLCGDPTPTRGHCAPCAAQRRAAAAAAHQRIAEIRVECRVELPQHVEPVAPPPPTRPVERLTLPPLPKPPEKPASAPKPVQAAADMAREPKRVVAPPKPPAAPRLPPVLEVDESAPVGCCRLRGCGRRISYRGVCENHRKVLASRGRTDLMLPTGRNTAPRDDLRPKILEAIAAEPGLTPQRIQALTGATKNEVGGQLMLLRRRGLVACPFRGTYALPGVKVEPVQVTDRILEHLRAKGTPQRPFWAQDALGLSDASMSAALARLRDERKIRRGRNGVYGDAIWLPDSP